MLVKRLSDGKEFTTEKNGDMLYPIEDKFYSAEEMKGNFEIMKAVAKKVIPKKKAPTTLEESLVGTLLSETGHSESLGKLAFALSKAQAEFSGVKKESEGYGYSFASLDAVIRASAPVFTKYELAITQDTLGCVVDGIYYAGVKTMLMHSSGEWKSATGWIPTERSKQNPLVQMFGVNSTYFRRYQYQAILGLATTDSDGV